MSYWGVKLATADASFFVVAFLVVSFVGAFIVLYGLVFLAVVLVSLTVTLVSRAVAQRREKKALRDHA